ncbi:MAG: hypothetical protein AB8B78_00695 [Polaribacter sp.]
MNVLKKISLLILIIFSNCTAQEEVNALEITYSAQTRGSSLTISYNSLILELKTNNSNKKIVLNKNQKEKLLKEVSKITLTEIANLKAPTNKRFSDGALVGKFSILKNQKQYISSEFDHGNPPEELNNLYLLLESLLN